MCTKYEESSTASALFTHHRGDLQRGKDTEAAESLARVRRNTGVSGSRCGEHKVHAETKCQVRALVLKIKGAMTRVWTRVEKVSLDGKTSCEK